MLKNYPYALDSPKLLGKFEIYLMSTIMVNGTLAIADSYSNAHIDVIDDY